MELLTEKVVSGLCVDVAEQLQTHCKAAGRKSSDLADTDLFKDPSTYAQTIALVEARLRAALVSVGNLKGNVEAVQRARQESRKLDGLDLQVIMEKLKEGQKSLDDSSLPALG